MRITAFREACFQENGAKGENQKPLLYKDCSYSYNRSIRWLPAYLKRRLIGTDNSFGTETKDHSKQKKQSHTWLCFFFLSWNQIRLEKFKSNPVLADNDFKYIKIIHWNHIYTIFEIR